MKVLGNNLSNIAYSAHTIWKKIVGRNLLFLLIMQIGRKATGVKTKFPLFMITEYIKRGTRSEEIHI